MINEIGAECLKVLHRAGIMHNVYWIRLSECICIDFTLSICVHRSEATGLGVFLLFIWALTGMTRQFCYASNGNNKWLIAFGNTKITPYFKYFSKYGNLVAELFPLVHTYDWFSILKIDQSEHCLHLALLWNVLKSSRRFHLNKAIVRGLRSYMFGKI